MSVDFDFPLGLLYNMSMTIFDGELCREGEAVPSVPFEDSDELIDGGRYKDRRGIVVVMEAVNPNIPEAKHGFLFRSSRGVFYRPNGTTMEEYNRSQVDDIAEKVTAEIIPFKQKE